MIDMQNRGLPARRPAAHRPVLAPPSVGHQQYVTLEPTDGLPGQAGEQQGLMESLRRIARHRLLILFCMLVFGGVAAAVAWSMPAYYTAEARVLVGVQSPRILNVEAMLADISPDAERVQNAGFALQSRMLAKQVIDRLKLAEDAQFNPALRPPSFWSQLNPLRYLPPLILEKLSSATVDTEPSIAETRLIDVFLTRVDVSTLGRSHVLSVKAEATNPRTAAAIANVLAELYLDDQRNDKVDAMDRVDKFLMGRVAELRDQVRKSDQSVEDYRRANGLYKTGTGSITTQQLSELNTQLTAAQTAMIEAASRLQEAQEMRKGGLGGGESVPEVLRSPLITALRQQQTDAERRAAEMGATYGERHQALRSARAEAGNIAGRVQSEITKIIEGLNREARSAGARYETLKQNFEKLKATMGAVNDKSIELEALERDAAVNRNLLDAVLHRAKQSMGTTNMVQANAKLVSPAAARESPSYPPKTLLVFMGTLGGMLVGAGIALIRDRGDRTFRRPEQIETLTGLPVLAMVPEVSGRKSPAMQVMDKPTSPYGEALRRLLIGIELSEAASSPKTLLFSSAAPSEGKSVLVASLGRLHARNGKRVLLIDCDWRSPRLHQIFRCSNRYGLVKLLTDEEPFDDVVHRDPVSGVDVLAAGNWNPHSAHLLSSDRMRRLLLVLTLRYDYIILDAPPVLVTADVLILSQLVDKVVFIVRWGHTQREAASEALKHIIDAQGDLAGVVLSRVIARQYRKYASTPLNYQYKRPALATLRL